MLALTSALGVICFATTLVHVKLEECNDDDDDARWIDPVPAKMMLATRSNLTSNTAKAEKSLDDIRVLLYVTTHLSVDHLDFLRACWPALIANSVLLQHADVLLFTAEDVPEDVHSIFRNNSLRVQKYDNPGYQEGAKLAMKWLTENSVYADYDWVIRVNPDVLILDDDWLIQNMLDDDVGGIFADCAADKVKCWQYCVNGTMTNSDFFAVRTMHLKPWLFTDLKGADGKPCWNAECEVHVAFESIRLSGRDRWIQGTRMDGAHGGDCRIRGDNVPVLHAHTVVQQCPLAKGEPADRNIV